MSLQITTQTVNTWMPKAPASFAEKCQQAIDVIKDTMGRVTVTSISNSFGKDSSCVMALTLEAARQIKAETGKNPIVRMITSDTLVEMPTQTKLSATMSARALEWAQYHDLDVEQVWVQPDPADHYLAMMIGMRGVASVPGSDATCSVNMKVRPMQKMQREFAKAYGAENIAVLIGTRFEESTERNKNMKARGESANKAVRQESGSLQLSPIADWTEADVWRLLNGTPRTTGFESLDYAPVILHYELIGDSTCGTLSIAQTAKQNTSPCAGGRGGCVICQKVDDDSGMNNLAEKMPQFAPLARLSRTIRAGHNLPENRNFTGKTVDDSGRIRCFSNSYSASWTRQLLAWVMSIDANEDDYAQAQSERRDRKVERRFAPLMTTENLLMVAFQWARYGIQAPGAFWRIREAIAQGVRYELPTDEDLANMHARADKKMMGKTFGYLHVPEIEQGKPRFTDNWRDMVGTESNCAPEIMLTDSGDRAMYRSTSGMIHDTIETSSLIQADLSGFESDTELEDFLWWAASEYAGGTKTHNDEMNFLLRHVIRARNGYQSTLADYQRQNLVLQAVNEKGPVSTLAQIMDHPLFVSAADTKTQEDAASASKPTPMLIATSNAPAINRTALAANTDAGQLDLLFA